MPGRKPRKRKANARAPPAAANPSPPHPRSPVEPVSGPPARRVRARAPRGAGPLDAAQGGGAPSPPPAGRGGRRATRRKATGQAAAAPAPAPDPVPAPAAAAAARAPPGGGARGGGGPPPKKAKAAKKKGNIWRGHPGWTYRQGKGLVEWIYTAPDGEEFTDEESALLYDGELHKQVKIDPPSRPACVWCSRVHGNTNRTWEHCERCNLPLCKGVGSGRECFDLHRFHGIPPTAAQRNKDKKLDLKWRMIQASDQAGEGQHPNSLKIREALKVKKSAA